MANSFNTGGKTTAIGVNEFDKSALTYRKELLMIPILALGKSLEHMTLRPGIRYGERVGSMDVDVELAPYKPSSFTDVNLNVAFRELNTFFGAVNANFEPNASISTVLGHMAARAMGEGMKNVPTAKAVLAMVAKGVGKKLNASLFKAKRNATGKTTADLFDGFDTITEKEITEGAISAQAGNLIELNEEITRANAEKLLKEVVFKLPAELREQETKLYCSQTIADLYNESYQLNHGALLYNKEYSKTFIEGSAGRVEIVPLAGKADSKFMHLTTKGNMLVGCDQMGDMERVNVGKYMPDLLTMEMRLFFGTQFETVDKRVFQTIKLFQG